MTDKTAKQIANNLSKSRHHHGLTQSELAKKAGISTNYYARVERAEVKPTVETLERIVMAVGVKSSDILPF